LDHKYLVLCLISPSSTGKNAEIVGSDVVGDFQNNGITLEPKVVTLHGNLSYTLEPLAKGCLMNLCIDSSVYDDNLWQKGA
jgi:hypothetical protein